MVPGLMSVVALDVVRSLELNFDVEFFVRFWVVDIRSYESSLLLILRLDLSTNEVTSQ
jgi:hypothetical protein